MTLCDALIAFDSGKMTNKQVIELFSELITSGMVWRLHGFYVRTAKGLIDSGKLDNDGNILEIYNYED